MFSVNKKKLYKTSVNRKSFKCDMSIQQSIEDPKWAFRHKQTYRRFSFYRKELYVLQVTINTTLLEGSLDGFLFVKTFRSPMPIEETSKAFRRLRSPILKFKLVVLPSKKKKYIYRSFDLLSIGQMEFFSASSNSRRIKDFLKILYIL